MSEDKTNRSLNYALWLLARRPYCEKQIHEKLARKEFLSEEIEATMIRLKELKFLDDAELARSFIRQSITGKAKGARRIKFELLRKGVDKEIVEQVLLESGLSEGETDLATETLQRFGRRFKKLDSHKRYEKAIRFLITRGFSFDDSKKAYETVLKK